MWYNLKIILRNLRRNGVYSVINIVGLVIGLLSSLFIFMWIGNEYSYDRFHKNGENIYRGIAYWDDSESVEDYWATLPMLLGPTAKETVGDIESYCRIYKYWEPEFIKYPAENRSLSGEDLKVYGVDTSFFDIFSFEVIRGDQKTFLNDISSMLVSESIASQLFGNEDPIGKSVVDNRNNTFTITGIFADVPSNSSLEFNVIIPFSFIRRVNAQDEHKWGTLNYHTYFDLNPISDVSQVEKKIEEIFHSKENMEDTHILLHPIYKSRLYLNDLTPNVILKECRMFFIIAVIILVMACINYVNLVTARSSKRIKEISIRSILGAKKKKLFFYFFNETIILFFISLVIALIILIAGEPMLVNLFGRDFDVEILSINTLLIVVSVFVFISISGGIYPALILTNKYSLGLGSSSSVNRTHGGFVRQILVIIQFVAVTILVMGMVTISRQMKYIRSKDMGYNMENVLYIPMTRPLIEKRESVRSELESNPNVRSVSLLSQRINNITAYSSKEIDERWVKFIMFNTDKYFIETLGIELLYGDNFIGGKSDSVSFILNQSAVKALGLDKNPVGMELEYNGTDGMIVGVVKDFNHRNLKEQIDPMVIMTMYNTWTNFLYVKTTPNYASVVEELRGIWERYNPDVEFKYSFLKEDFKKDYKRDIQSGRLINIFTIISLVIACLGIFGLITYTAERRSKEIAIRKVLGANIRDIILTICKELIMLLFISLLIGFPLAYLWLSGFLKGYTYHISITWDIFLISGILTIIIAIATILYKTMKAANANPVKSIKSE